MPCEENRPSLFRDVSSRHNAATSRFTFFQMQARQLIYVVTYQDLLAVDQNLLVAKARVSPKGLSILRLELVAAHTLEKLQNGVSKALISFPITGYHNWVNSMTALYWLANCREWSTFVRKRVKKIEELTDSYWKDVPTSENPSDLGTQGAAPDKLTQTLVQGQPVSHPEFSL